MKGDTVPSFAILTDEPNELVAPFHDRMPVVLDDPEAWLTIRRHGWKPTPRSTTSNRLGRKLSRSAQ
jgi:putative SOS response-associated peptidase YedK